MDIEFNSSGGTSIVTYAINCDGTVKFVSSDESWLHIEVESRRITITVDENEGQSGRTGTITPSVNGTDCPNKVINVRQKKGSQPEPPTPDCEVSAVTYDFGYREINVDPCKTSVEFEIPYTATTSYTDSEQCEDEINTGFSSVTVTFDGIKCEEEEEIITGDHYTVTRASGLCETCGCKEYIYHVYYPEGLELDNCGTPERITITGDFNCVNPSGDTNGFTPNVTWSLSGNEEVYLRGEGNTATVSANSNCDTSDISGKTATISLSAYTEQREFISAITIPVVQLSGKCDSCEPQDTCGCESITVTPISNNLPYTSGNNVKLASANVGADCINRFSFASSNSNFISNIRISNGDVVGNISENSSENDRTATITVKFDTNTTCPSFTITQEGRVRYNEIRPYVVRISYENPSTQSPSGVPERYGYYLHFKSYGDTNPLNGNNTTNKPIAVNNKVTFFADDNNCFTTFIDGSDCAGLSCGHPQGLPNRPYLNANESDTLVYDANPVTYANNIKNGVFLRNATEACVNDHGFEYWYSETDIDFLGTTSGSTIMQGYKRGASSVDSYYDGVRSVYLKIPDQSELQIVEGPHVLKASQVTFNSDDGDTTVSVYKDGTTFIDSSNIEELPHEMFSSITQFADTVYPNKSYNSIQACQLFNGAVPLDDFGQHTCFNDIVIEDGELIRRDESIPSPTVAMHIELDETPSSTQAIHIEEENS